ncbi:hypothetical protein [Streptomyces sp. NPDC006879]|uniref:hypothetical protein n=1 Tax=Streptomyces sp. NPDC006879 TaxID=3364767 RepID=UPI0036C1A316
MDAGPRDSGRDAPETTSGALGESAPRSGSETVPTAGSGLPAEPDRLSSDGPEHEEPVPEYEVELRPRRRLRLWQLAPIVSLAAAGSLMFAFPLAFEFGDGGAVVAMLGLLISCCAAGWGMMAARRVGHTWPGLPARGSGGRPNWWVVALYAGIVLTLAVLAVWRVARLR